MRANNSRGSSPLAFWSGDRTVDTPTPPVFCKKSLQSIENKGREHGKEPQESSRARKGLKGKEIEEVEEVKEIGEGMLLGRRASETMVAQVFTSDDRTDYRSCQYIKWVLVFRDWAQNSTSIRKRQEGRHTQQRRMGHRASP
jgi:hypothetical protein